MMSNRWYALSLALALAALAWPSFYELASGLAASPLERALNAAHCGAGAYGSPLLGHCLACWSGAAALLAASALTATTTRIGGPRLRRA